MSQSMTTQSAEEPTVRPRNIRRTLFTSHAAQGEPNVWVLGGALSLGILMVLGFLALVLWNGIATFWPGPIQIVTLQNGDIIAGEMNREELYRVSPEDLATLEPAKQDAIRAQGGLTQRRLYRIGNFDLYGEDFRWVIGHDIASIDYPKDVYLIERLEWGVFIGRLKGLKLGGADVDVGGFSDPKFTAAYSVARKRWEQIREIEKYGIGAINHQLNQERLGVRKIALKKGSGSPEHAAALAALAGMEEQLTREFQRLSAEADRLKQEDSGDIAILADVTGREKAQPLSSLVRMSPSNDLGLAGKLGVYFSRWLEFLTDEPREANTEGGVMPAIFGTFAMTVLLSLIVAPVGVITALYLREYAKQGRLVSFVRISVNNLAGVPSIVYGVFGLGFFAYTLGGSIDAIFYPERLPNPTFGTGGLLWSALTLAIMTVPVVIVATEEALSAVPRSMREGSLACGASKWQTIQRIVLPRAMPGIMTGLILAMARGAGEVAPLMLVGVVKLAPELPIDGIFPYIHLERSFMHLGFHIYDVGFQSRNSEAGKPMVFVTTVLLIILIGVMNAGAIYIRERLKRRFAGSQF